MSGSADRPIVLLGSMGSGKTTVGRLLATRLDRPFLDNDAAIRARTGATAHELEQREGIDVVHRLEAEVLLDALSSLPPAVIAAAASIVDDADVHRHLATGAQLVIWLRVPPTLLAERASRGEERPDLGTNAGEAAVRLGAARRIAYAHVADMTIDVGDRTPGEVVDEIADQLA